MNTDLYIVTTTWRSRRGSREWKTYKIYADLSTARGVATAYRRGRHDTWTDEVIDSKVTKVDEEVPVEWRSAAL